MHAQFDRESIKLRWSFEDLRALSIGFDQGWKLRFFEEGNSNIIHEILVHAKPDHEILSLISSPADSMTFEIYKDLRDRNLSFESSDQEAWFQLGFHFGIFDNFELAKALGLGYEAADLDTTKKYRVQIDLQHADPRFHIPAFQTVTFLDPVKRPKPETPSVECKQNQISVTALLSKSATMYSSFSLERANGQGPFLPVNSRPLIVNHAYGEPLIAIDDTIGSDVPVQYRLVGKDFWGDYGPYSEIVSIIPCDIIFVPPHPVLANETHEKGAIVVSWLIPDSIQPLLAGFHIYRSAAKFGEYEQINRLLLLPTQSEFTDLHPISVGYYQVSAIYKNGEEKKSLSVYASLWDTQPPEIPTNLQAELDTNEMVVKLGWNAVEAPDLKGYRVFFAHGPASAKYLLNNVETTALVLFDTLDKAQLHQQIYYWVTSRDYSQNESFYSDSVVVIIPNTIPPAAPRLTHTVSGANYIDIHYDRSASSGLINHVLQRKKRSEEDWISIPLNPKDWHNQFRDSTVLDFDTIEYRVAAYDGYGLMSLSNAVSTSLREPVMLDPLEYVKAENHDSVAFIYFDYRDDLHPMRFRVMSGPSPHELQTLSVIDAQDILLQSGIAKQDTKGTYSLYRFVLKPLDGSLKYFKVRAISTSGKVSPYSQIFTY